MLNQSLDHITAYVSVRSLGGVSLFDGKAVVNSESVEQFKSSDEMCRSACVEVEEMGFRVERVTPLSVRISGPADLFTNRMGLRFERYRSVELESGFESISDSDPWTPTVETGVNLLEVGSNLLEGVVFPQPVALHQHAPPSANPPAPRYHHLQVPHDIVAQLNAEPVHDDGFRGQNVRAAMIDSGFHWSHPYFRARNYNLRVALQPEGILQDSNGHGTGESANLLAVAPDVELFGIAMDDIIEAFQVARDDLAVQVVSNSWGSRWPTDGPNGTWDPYWSLVQAEIALCVAQGMIVLFSGGNGGMSFTASMPETISVGGVYADDQGGLNASDYASSFDSTRFPGQHVPEICGLCGMQPRAIYITLPVPPRSEIDQGLGSGKFPNGDETRRDDGWGVFSGTSAACPMAAGVVALILSKHPGEDLNGIRNRLYNATDVTMGASAHGDAAGLGFDAATGHGLVNAQLACA